jgi:SEL1 protein
MAHSIMGFLSFEGLGTPFDIVASQLYHSFAAMEGNIFSQMVMGYRYFNGIASPRSCEESAYQYFQVASKGLNHSQL